MDAITYIPPARLGGAWARVLTGLLLSCMAAYPASAFKAIPIIPKHDVRFVTLSVDGEPFKRHVLSIARDNQGFLWLGTTSGLYRYDGYSLKNYRHDPGAPGSLSDNTVKAIFKDRAGNLWVGTSYGGLDKLDPDHGTFIHYRHDARDARTFAGNGATSIYQDRAGAIWIATGPGLDRLDPATGVFTHYRHEPNNPASLSDGLVDSVSEDRLGNLWVSTFNGLNRLDPSTGRVTRYLHDPADPRSLGDNRVGPVLEDRAGVLWVGTGNQLDALDRRSGQFTHYSLQSDQPGREAVAGITSMHEDRDGVLWMGLAENGLVRLDRERKELTRNVHDSLDPNSLCDNTVSAIFEDPEGIIWVGAQSGVSRFFSNSSGFATYRHQASGTEELRDNVIWSVQEDSHGFLWIGTPSGLHRLDRRTGQFTFYQHDPKDPHSISYNIVSSVREGRSGALWFGTYGGGLNRFDRATGRFTAYRRVPTRPDSLSSDRVLCLLEDHEGYLWVGTGGGGLGRFDPRTGRFRTFRHDPNDPGSLSDDDVKTVFEDRQGTLWAGTNRGLNRFDRATGRFLVYLNTRIPGSLSGSPVNSIHEDRQGRLWIGTRAGLNRLERDSGTFTRFTTKDGLPDDSVESILEDASGNLWFATHYGLSQFDPLAGTFQNYSELDGLAGNNMNPYGSEAACRTSGGELVFGSTDGVTIFHPDRIVPNRYIPPLVFTDFLLFGKSVGLGGDSPLTRQIWTLDSLRLNPHQTIFTLEFSALSFAAPEKNRYRYRLEGLESQWNESDSRRRTATYTSLPPGRYVFRVQGSNDAGSWNEKGATLAITVVPPWWATLWFRSLLVLVALGLAFAVHRFRLRSLRRSTARLERQVSERTRELSVAKEAAEAANRSKSAFLANMSHELRTPLNAILGFARLLQDGAASESQRKDLSIISRSGEHLLRLIDDVLDFAKIETGRVALEVAPCDLGSIAREVVEMMCVRAAEKGLKLLFFELPEFPRYVRADAPKLRQILINLLGNAIRHTDRGSISLRLSGQSGSDPQRPRLIVEVEDTGIGVAAEDHKRIFDAFVQVGKNTHHKGTGLGLTISRQFVELMGGAIQVESALGQGSLFRVEIPVERAREADVSVSADDGRRVIGLEPGQPECRVLVVDDEPDNLVILERLLRSAGFPVQTAADGAAAVAIFESWRPHFIWMDLRMPVMDGVEATRRIRALDGGRQVKIAAVTASASEADRNQVLAASLDDFIRKPFPTSEIFDCMARHLGLRYRTEAAPAGGREAPATVTPEALAALPPDLRAELRSAVTALHAKRIADAIGRIAGCDTALSSALAQWADGLAYTAILNALDGCEALHHK
jgi:signal transduction histidine kinase/ligand-binding sensor domain-containing protein/DNA-binding NarL/FixJ family response regulator